MPDNSSIKPLITDEMVLPLLQEYFGQPVQNLQIVPGGNVAQTFSFTVDSGHGEGVSNLGVARDYIIRFNATMLVNFEKEAYVYSNFASPSIPIPQVVHIGRLESVHFAISEKAPGQNLLQIPRPEYLALVPKQIDLLDTIHQVPLGDRPGYGIFDGAGVAHWSSWKSHLELVREEEPAGDFFGKWHSLFDNSFLERDLFEQLDNHMMQLIGYCPEERYLVHGNYGFGNLLTQNGEITAVIDWMNARYGDFLYDVAWLDFWSPQDRWHDRFAQHYRQVQRAVPSYSERILCYQCYIGMDGLKFYAKAGHKANYDYAKARILSLIDGR